MTLAYEGHKDFEKLQKTLKLWRDTSEWDNYFILGSLVHQGPLLFETEWDCAEEGDPRLPYPQRQAEPQHECTDVA